MKLRRIAIFLFLLTPAQAVLAGVLPDDRTDLLYHRYEGGGVVIDGPSLLVRKKVGKSVSLVGNYYVDMVSSASIDVVTTASPYSEERTQWSLGMDYLRGNTTISTNYTSSTESDFDATTYSLAISQDMFGDMTTLTLSYALGDDIVGRSDDLTFVRDNTRQHYGIGLTQIMTRNLITSLNVETITDEGYLNNPYRSVRYLDPVSAIGYSYEPELYPSTRTTTAVGLRARYFLPYRAAVQGEYRFFTDTWGVDSNTLAISYIHPWRDWTFEAKYRWHNQKGAHFYRDIFARSEATNFRGRDKELSALTSNSLRLKVSYSFLKDGWSFVERGSVNFSIDMLSVDYDEFSDLTTGAALGSEPLYTLDANVVQLFVSFWY
jgi:nuclear transport factor 2 (NTF2) superfamily protein